MCFNGSFLSVAEYGHGFRVVSLLFQRSGVFYDFSVHMVVTNISFTSASRVIYASVLSKP